MPAAPTDTTRDDWRRLRAENRLAREKLESARLAAAARHQERRGRLLESMSLDWVTPYADLLDRYRSASDPILAGPSSAWQRRQGRNYPIYQTEQELNLLRAPARLLVATSGYAQGLLSGLTSYVIGSGYTYRVAKKTRESEAPDELVRACQKIVDDFLRRNQWYGGEHPGMEEELFERSVEDGEFALVSTPNEDGTTDVRTAEPEQITEPPPRELEEGEDGLFGVLTPKDDVQKVLGYWVQWGDAPDDGERVPADRLTHFRRNVRRSMKRGVTDFCFDTLDALSLAATLRTNLGDGAAQQAAIVMVRQHATGSQSDIEAFNDAAADFTKRDPLTGTEQRYRKMRRGGHEDIPEGMQYVAGPGAQNAPAHLSILQGLLRSAGVKWNAPEWLASADASNNNYSSSLTAESPFVKTVTRRQRGYREAFRRPVWAALQHYVEVRGVVADGREWSWGEVCRELDLLVEAPSPETRNRLSEAQQAQIDIPLGADSRQQYAQRQGRDFDQIEADNQAWDDKHGGAGDQLPLPGDPDADGLPGTTPDQQEQPPADAGVTESLLESVSEGTFAAVVGAGLWLLEDATGGLVAKQVTVHPSAGKAYQRTVMVRAGVSPAAESSPGGADATHATPSGGVARATAAVKAVGSAALQTRVGKFLVAAEHKLSIVAHKMRDVAAEAARRRKPPMSDEGVSRLTRTLAVADFVGGYVTGGVAAVAIHPVVGKAAAFLPSASALYVAYSAARNPAGTWAAARKVVRDTIAGRGVHESILESEAPTLTPALIDKLAAILDGPGADWREVVFLAALAETGDPDRAVEVAAAAGDMPSVLPEPTADDFGEEDDGGLEESVSEDTFAAMIESGAWLAEEVDADGRTLLEAGAGLTPKQITVHPQTGQAYQRTVMVKAGDDLPSGHTRPAASNEWKSHPATVAMATALRSATGISDEQRATYGRAAGAVLGRMPKAAHDRLHANLKAAHFHPDNGAVAEGIAAEIEGFAPANAAKIRETVAAGRQIGGGFINKTGAVHTDGGLPAGGPTTSRVLPENTPAHMYAHEWAHAIDGPDQQISKSPAWQEAFAAEFGDGRLTAYASGKPSEAFAEFARAVYALPPASLPKVEAAFPKAAAVWKEHGLWPA